MILYDALYSEGHSLHMPGGPWTRQNHLQNPYTAYQLMKRVFWGYWRIVAGGLPLLPPLPPGAVR